MGLQPDLSVYPDAAARHVSTKTWGVATTASAPPATLRFEEARKDAHAAYFERTLPGRSAQQPAWVEEDRKEANRPFGDAWDSRALPTPEFQQPGPPIELEADGVTVRAAGMDSQKYRMTQGYTASGLRMDKDCWGRPFGH